MKLPCVCNTRLLNRFKTGLMRCLSRQRSLPPRLISISFIQTNNERTDYSEWSSHLREHTAIFIAVFDSYMTNYIQTYDVCSQMHFFTSEDFFTNGNKIIKEMI